MTLPAPSVHETPCEVCGLLEQQRERLTERLAKEAA